MSNSLQGTSRLAIFLGCLSPKNWYRNPEKLCPQGVLWSTVTDKSRWDKTNGLSRAVRRHRGAGELVGALANLRTSWPVGFIPEEVRVIFELALMVALTRRTLHCAECTPPGGHRPTRQTHIIESTGASGPDGRPAQISVIWGTEGPEFESRQPDRTMWRSDANS